MMRDVLKVILWGQEIGRLAWHDARKTTFFVYNPEVFLNAGDMPLVSNSMRSYKGQIRYLFDDKGVRINFSSHSGMK